MVLPVVIVGVALFFLAFVGLKDMWHTIFGLASIIGLIGGIYLVWIGLSSNTQNTFVTGCVILLVAGGILIYLKSASGD